MSWLDQIDKVHTWRSKHQFCVFRISVFISWFQLTKGRRHYFYTKNFGENSKLGLTPPPPRLDNSEIFEFQNYLKNADPPSRIKFRHFLIWEHIDGGRPLRADILKGIFRHIYIENGQRLFIFILLDGLREWFIIS